MDWILAFVRDEQRKEKIFALMREDGLYYDYDFGNGKRSKVLSCASFFPYFVGIDNDVTGFQKALERLERPFGLVACDFEETCYQWSTPNSWAPLNFIAVSSAQRLGLEKEMKRIAEKYVQATDELFRKTGKLWEKYNAENGELDHESEYDACYARLGGWRLCRM